MSAVGAFQWKGGYQDYSSGSSFQTGSEHESYQGEVKKPLKYIKHIDVVFI